MALVQISLAGETESRRQHWIRQRARHRQVVRRVVDQDGNVLDILIQSQRNSPRVSSRSF